MSWDYSDLSHIASTHGGPEKYINKIKLYERQKTTSTVNKRWMRDAIPILTVLMPFAAKGVFEVIEEYRQKKAISDAEVKQAEEKLIKQFEESDCDDLCSEEPSC